MPGTLSTHDAFPPIEPARRAMSEVIGIGAAPRRKEDFRFLTGRGNYVADIERPETVVRRFRALAARAREDQVYRIRAPRSPCPMCLPYSPAPISRLTGSTDCPAVGASRGSDGQPMKEPSHPAMAQDEVRYVGDAVAFVVAESVRAGARRGRRTGGGLRRAACRHRPLGCAQAGRRARVRRCAQQSVLRLGPRRQGRHRGCFKQGCPCRPYQAREQPALSATRWSRAPRSRNFIPKPVTTRYGRRPVSARGAAAHGSVRAQYPAAKAAGDRPRCRRRISA